MKLILISPPRTLKNEHLLVNALFQQGLEYYHLRKPDFSQREQEEYLKSIGARYLKNVVIHQHHKLVQRYNLAGLHLSEPMAKSLNDGEWRELKKSISGKRLSISASLHSPDDLKDIPDFLDYVFLSPVFDSLSKPGHQANKDIGVIPIQIRVPVIALGGIEDSNIAELSDRNFSGAAILGGIWNDWEISNDLNEAVEKFLILRGKAEKVKWKQADLIY